MSKPKEYRLVTIADIVDVITPENIDNFMIDFKSFIQTTQNLLHITRVLDPELKDKKNSEIGEPVFNWIDDGKHDQTGGLRVTHPTSGEQIDLTMDIDMMNRLAEALKRLNAI